MPQVRRSADPPAEHGRTGRGQRLAGTVLAGLSLISLTSCATLGPDADAAAGVAAAFHRAVADGDVQAACDLLAPATVEDLESTSGQACSEAIGDQDVPEAGRVQDAQAFGRGAQVLMDGDVVFLSIFDGHWLVTGAGCRARGDRPYDCILKGG